MKIILLDLDGTLTNTAHASFKPMKDGKEETELSKIPLFDGALEFVKSLKEKGYEAIIASDSHPRYVRKIAEQIFDLEYISLCDKPNISKVRNYLFDRSLDTVGHPNIDEKSEKDDFFMIGDSWLDIELGRRLKIKTILTKFYKAKSVEARDGIGQDWKPIKIGPTYYAKSFDEILDIIEKPFENLLSIEAIFQGKKSDKMVRFLRRNYNGNFTAFRCLARQEDGECDRFARADKYFQIDNFRRSPEFLKNLAQGVSNYLKRVAKYPEYEWHYLTYVTDKKTTKPPNKMKEIFDLIESKYPKIEMFKWVDDVDGKLRQQPDYKARRAFISKNINIINEVDVKGKNIIIIDDQFTSSATGNEIAYQLRKNGTKNILFVALFYLILPIVSKTCPRSVNGETCGQPLKIKIRKLDGNKFYSCVPPKYGGKGCGYTENIR
jgi:FMN phosphatase YigB (HAD superfamily)